MDKNPESIPPVLAMKSQICVRLLDTTTGDMDSGPDLATGCAGHDAIPE